MSSSNFQNEQLKGIGKEMKKIRNWQKSSGFISIYLLTNIPPKQKILLLEEVQRTSTAAADSEYTVLNLHVH